MATILGIDVSHWQGAMDWDVAASKAEFAVIRAGSIDNSSGIPYEDLNLSENKVAQDKMPVGFYWFFRPKWNPILQAEYFWVLVEDLDWFVLVADCEAFDGVTAAGATNSIKQFLDRLEELSGKRPMIYTRQSVWDPNTLSLSAWSSYDLWAARYASWLTSPWSDGGFVFRDWLQWTFWQFSAGGNNKGAEFGASSDDIDINYFNGSLDEFESYFGIGETPPVEKTIMKLSHYVYSGILLNVGSEPTFVNVKVPEGKDWIILAAEYKVNKVANEVIVRFSRSPGVVTMRVDKNALYHTPVPELADMGLGPEDTLQFRVINSMDGNTMRVALRVLEMELSE